jgi:chromosome partitioning protein
MQKIATTQQKGGVGKTAVTATVSAALADKDFDVLAIDLDPQGYLTRHFGLKDELYRENIDNIALHLVGESEGEFTDLIEETEEGVDLVPSNYDMRGVSDALSNARNREMRLSNVLEDVDPDMYDFLLIDTPPNLGILTDNAILAAQNLLIPIQAEDSSLDALDMALDEVEEIEEAFNIDISILGIIPNLVPRDGVAETTLETVRSTQGLKELVFDYEIRKRADMKYAMRKGETLYSYNPDSDMIPVFDQLADDVANALN